MPAGPGHDSDGRSQGSELTAAKRRLTELTGDLGDARKAKDEAMEQLHEANRKLEKVGRVERPQVPPLRIACLRSLRPPTLAPSMEGDAVVLERLPHLLDPFRALAALPWDLTMAGPEEAGQGQGQDPGVPEPSESGGSLTTSRGPARVSAMFFVPLLVACRRVSCFPHRGCSWHSRQPSGLRRARIMGSLSSSSSLRIRS